MRRSFSEHHLATRWRNQCPLLEKTEVAWNRLRMIRGDISGL